MSGWQTHQGIAAALAMDNVDTDQLIPARFMSTPRSEGYGPFLLHDLRAAAPEAFASLNGASVWVSQRNFGCGSSREAAVYALVDAGVRAVFAPSFGDIFAANAVNNGLLPGVINEADMADLLAALEDVQAPAEIDLTTSASRIGAHPFTFSLPETQKLKLIKGWDDIDLTHAHDARIRDFASERRRCAPWTWPTAVDRSD